MLRNHRPVVFSSIPGTTSMASAYVLLLSLVCARRRDQLLLCCVLYALSCLDGPARPYDTFTMFSVHMSLHSLVSRIYLLPLEVSSPSNPLTTLPSHAAPTLHIQLHSDILIRRSPMSDQMTRRLTPDRHLTQSAYGVKGVGGGRDCPLNLYSYLYASVSRTKSTYECA